MTSLGSIPISEFSMPQLSSLYVTRGPVHENSFTPRGGGSSLARSAPSQSLGTPGDVQLMA